MQKHRKIAGIILVVMFIAIVPAFIKGGKTNADTSPVAKFFIGQTKYTVNNVSHSMDVAPYFKNYQTYIPLRYAANAMGVPDSDITWNGLTGAVTIVQGSATIVMVIGSTIVTVDGVAKTLDLSPEIRNGRTMIPNEFQGLFGARVDIDRDTHTVTLTYGDGG